MGLLDSLTSMLGTSGTVPAGAAVGGTADVPEDVLAKSLGAAFASNETPAIGNIVSQLFAQSNGAQQAGMLNQIIAALGPAASAALGGGALGNVMAPGQTSVTPAQASQLTPQQVQDVVNHANELHPGLADQLGQFYAQHRGLVNTLGGIVASVALMKMKDHLAGR